VACQALQFRLLLIEILQNVQGRPLRLFQRRQTLAQVRGFRDGLCFVSHDHAP
jgi:hypothetical protein